MRRAMRNARLIGAAGPLSLQAHRLRRRADAPGLSGDDGKRAARGARREGRRASLRHHVPGCGEESSATRSKSARQRQFSGRGLFKLYDTYGLALDEQEDMARERGLAIDRDGLRTRDGAAARARPRQLERRGKGRVAPALSELLEQGRTNFWATSKLEARVDVIGLLVDKQPVEFVAAGATRNWSSIRRRSTPKPAARWATAGASTERRNSAKASPLWKTRIPAFPA